MMRSRRSGVPAATTYSNLTPHLSHLIISQTVFTLAMAPEAGNFRTSAYLSEAYYSIRLQGRAKLRTRIYEDDEHDGNGGIP